MAIGYREALRFAKDLAPTLDKPTEFIVWAEDICALLCEIYEHDGYDYDSITQDLYDAVKERDGWEDVDEDEDELEERPW